MQTLPKGGPHGGFAFDPKSEPQARPVRAFRFAFEASGYVSFGPHRPIKRMMLIRGALGKSIPQCSNSNCPIELQPKLASVGREAVRIIVGVADRGGGAPELRARQQVDFVPVMLAQPVAIETVVYGL